MNHAETFFFSPFKVHSSKPSDNTMIFASGNAIFTFNLAFGLRNNLLKGMDICFMHNPHIPYFIKPVIWAK